ncbi:EcoAI/FtnUII family type I restriction enzme subunit R [Bradyrhizobium icense]|uniref:Restriction endonuclease subunit R n=1 Tax=Bradyrhizobium icense TaxID=1274631 RepID=A0A1B1U988_9BRAD|nr:DEAD/DEAH box helicase family protein [Bradyrhizobium icense]ANV99339.1 restriction endonuclease subunit R [Bradyrhizobium icense]
MNEAETRAEHIDPALKTAGWGVIAGSRIRREFFITPGRIEGHGKRGKALKADYVLEYRSHRLAVVEAKAWDEELTEGVGQAKDYAGKLSIRFAYSSNGKAIYAIDMREGGEGEVPAFPSPDELWNRTYEQQNGWRDRFAGVPYPDKGGSWEIRYYQQIAVERVLERIATGSQRMLLTLATGTGKTSIAFQIAWKLFEARWNLTGEPTRRPRILFLADRNGLANQAFNDFNSFAAFEDKALVRIDPEIIRKHGRVPKNGSVFFTIFQTFMSGTDSDGNPAPNFGDYPPDFFDFIIIDECHRGGANDESTWREILTYFKPAVQLGLTATPKRKANADTYKYFGEPIYTYSLREGINDGFLTPFKVKQIATTMDDYTYTPDDAIVEGEVVLGKRYVESDFNKVIVIPEREKYRVKLFLDQIDQSQKTLVFCATQAHALMVRDLINQMKKSKDPNYCVRVTAEDGALGDQHLRDFQDNDKTIPTILTTSQKLSTGVDARNIRNIVLMRPVNSMIEFKQIIGRGTRLYEGKDYFTIYDFVKAYQHFNDPEWDGEPVEPQETRPRPPRGDEEEPAPRDDDGGDEEPNRQQKLKIKLADGKERTIQHMMATSFWSADGKPMSAAQFIERLFGELPALFKNEDELRALWSEPGTRKALLDGLAEKGFGDAQLAEIRRLIDAEKSDLYDVLAYIAFALAPITREERVQTRKGTIFAQYGDHKLREFLDFVLAEYIKEGVGELDQSKLTPLLELKYRAVSDAARELGGIPKIRDTFIGFQRYLYADVAR